MNNILFCCVLYLDTNRLLITGTVDIG